MENLLEFIGVESFTTLIYFVMIFAGASYLGYATIKNRTQKK